jgi:hypothetical protein
MIFYYTQKFLDSPEVVEAIKSNHKICYLLNPSSYLPDTIPKEIRRKASQFMAISDHRTADRFNEVPDSCIRCPLNYPPNRLCYTVSGQPMCCIHLNKKDFYSSLNTSLRHLLRTMEVFYLSKPGSTCKEDSTSTKPKSPQLKK